MLKFWPLFLFSLDSPPSQLCVCGLITLLTAYFLFRFAFKNIQWHFVSIVVHGVCPCVPLFFQDLFVCASRGGPWLEYCTWLLSPGGLGGGEGGGGGGVGWVGEGFAEKSEQVLEGWLKGSMQRTRSHSRLKAISALLIAKTHYKHQLINNKTDLCLPMRPASFFNFFFTLCPHNSGRQTFVEFVFFRCVLYVERNCFVSMWVLTLRIDSCSGIKKMY